MKRTAPRILTLCLLFVGGCSSLKWPDGSPVIPGNGSPAAAYVAADKATYNAVAPEYWEYVKADPKLVQDQKDRRLRTLKTWELRIKSAQESGTTEPAPPVPTTLPSLPPIP